MIAQIMIEQVEQLLNWGFAGAVGVLILLATLLIFVVFSHIFGMNALIGQAAASPPTGLSALGNRIGARVLGALGFLTARLRVAFALGRTGIGRASCRERVCQYGEISV